MATNYTSLLGFALPTTGELSGTWGDVVNQSITELVEDAIAGSGTADVTSGDWTLTTTGSGAANQARNAILIPTGTPGTTRNIIAPSQSKAYIVDNQSNGAVVVKGSATTGATVAAGTTALVAWDGTDFVLVAQDLANATGTLAVNKGGTGQTSYTNGQLLIGNTTGNTLTKGTLTAGTGISITNGTGSITVAATNNGDVVGPASATDNAVARFDGTTGKLIQNSAVTIADDGTTVISTNSSSDALRITQTGSGNALVVEDSANPDSTPFVVAANGNVIVGNTTDSSSILGSKINVDGTLADAGIQFTRYSANASGPAIVSAKSRGASIGTRGAVSNNDVVGQLLFYGDDSSNWVLSSSIRVEVDGTPGTNDMPGRLVFSTTADGASSPTEALRINNQRRFGFNATDLSVINYRFAGNVSGSTISYLHYSEPTIQSGVTLAASTYVSVPSTQAATFTLTNLRHYSAAQGTFGAGSAVTNQQGFYAENNLTGATNNFGFYSNIASGTGRWNFYAAGSAANYFAGNVGIGVTPTVALDIFTATPQIKLQGTGTSSELRVLPNYGNSALGAIGTVGGSPFMIFTFNTERLRITSTGVSQFKAAVEETKTAIAASNIDLSVGNYFTKTISGATTFTVSNTAASGLVSSFVLDLTNGGSATVTWFSGVTWAAGTPPALTASGRDLLGFFTHDGGTTWNGLVLGLAMA